MTDYSSFISLHANDTLTMRGGFIYVRDDIVLTSLYEDYINKFIDSKMRNESDEEDDNDIRNSVLIEKAGRFIDLINNYENENLSPMRHLFDAYEATPTSLNDKCILRHALDGATMAVSVCQRWADIAPGVYSVKRKDLVYDCNYNVWINTYETGKKLFRDYLGEILEEAEEDKTLDAYLLRLIRKSYKTFKRYEAGLAMSIKITYTPTLRLLTKMHIHFFSEKEQDDDDDTPKVTWR